MILTIVIFFIAVITAFGMLAFREWEIRTNRIHANNETVMPPVSEISFRHVENNAKHITKDILQSLILIIAKYWLIMATKLKKWISENWPKIARLFQKKPKSPAGEELSFTKRAILESKSKIKKLKKKIKEEHE